ncbi:choice-of-anchor E domain-containing protein, partial [Arcicella aurantiaca]|uniref:choice-of-anchor E domain-containing protein n=1 Tax=Arcicella aurantiaca TaxID=591202 RepID=UPI0011B1D42C
VGCKDNTTGCETLSSNRANVSVVVNPFPTAPTNATSSKSAICVGESVVLSASCGANEAAQWYTSAGVLFTNLTVSPTVTTDYYVGCKNTSTGCETPSASRAKVTVTANPVPSAPTGVTPSTTICGTGVVNLVATCSLGKVNWYNGTTKLNSSPIASGIAFPVTVSSTTTYTASCIDDSKTTLCETASANRVNTVITVNSSPTPPTNATANKAVICSGETVTLSGTCVGGTTQWYEGSTLLTNLTFVLTNTLPTQITKTYSVGCSVTSNGVTCETPAANRALVTVKVNPIPAAPTDAQSDKKIVCSGETVVLSATCVSGTPKWYDGSTLITNLSQVLTNTTSSQITKTFTVGCSLANGATCETDIADRASVSIKVNPIPSKPTAVTQSSAICGPGTVNLSATCATGKVNWYNGTTKINATPIASGVAYPVTVNGTSTYTASCIDETASCVSGATNTVSYSYKTPFLTTDLNDVALALPKFNDEGGSKTLTKVELKYGILEGTNYLLENSAATTSTFSFKINANASIDLGTTNIATLAAVYSNPTVVLPAAISVPAQGTFGGDAPYGTSGTSTLMGMLSWLNPFLEDIYVNPTTDTRWVTNATGNATTDDDIYVMTPQTFSLKDSTTYTANLSQFVGTGTLPLTISTLNGMTMNGGGGNIVSLNKTKAYGYASIIYTATCSSPTTLYCETATVDRVSTTITVNANPTAPTDAKSNKTEVCLGETIVLSATCGAGEVAKWYDQAGASLTSLSFAPSPANTYNYYVGCRNTSSNCETASG